jgi:cyclic beta-1,2-glucan synthetase
LVIESERLMCLLTPPFKQLDHDPGYIRSYPEGVRENGGQYSHGVMWTVQALCLLGEGERAHWLFSLLNPISHGTNPAQVKRYRVEPYVLAGDVYASAQHLGRGGWSWYTGSAAWMYRIAVENMLGLKRQGNTLGISPCVPPDWRNFMVTYRYGKSELTVVFQNPDGVATGVQRVEHDGREQAGAELTLVDDGRSHQALVVMGRARAASALRDGSNLTHARSAE